MDKQPELDSNLLDSLKKEIDSSHSVIIALPPEPDLDLVASALGLGLSLEENGKQVQIGCPSDLKVSSSHLFGIDRIKNSIGNQNLVISFPFREEDLKKVDYDVSPNGKFMLLIQPQAGAQPPDISNIEYSYSGANADLVFVFGVSTPEELGKLYADEKHFFDNAKIININASQKPSNFGQYTINVKAFSCLAEYIGIILERTSIKPNSDAATNLLGQIVTATNQFNSPKATADTFQTVAYLMKAGGSLHGSPLDNSSRFGAFPPSPFSPLNPPTFDDGGFDDFAPGQSPFPAQFGPQSFPNSLPKRRGAPGDWRKPKVFRTNNSQNPEPGSQT